MLYMGKACASLHQMENLPSLESIISSLHDCRERKNAMHAMKVYIDICEGGFDAHTQIANYLIPTLVQCKSLRAAENVFNKLLNRNEYCWTSLLHGYVECGQSQHALYSLKRMEDDCVQPSKHTLSILLKAAAKLRRVEEGQELHAMIVEEGFERDSFVGISLMNMYAKCGLLAYAHDVFDELSTRNVVSWTTLIAGYSEYGDDAEALSCLEQMQNEGLLPDSVAFSCGLKACGAMRSMEKGRLLHTDVIKEGVEGDSFVCSSLVDMYAQCGSVVEAQEVFDDSPVRDVFTWNALFSSYAKHGRADEVLDWLRQMTLEGISPDANSYACSLKACKNIKAMEKGQEIHSEVVKEGRDHDCSIGNSLVDMYLGCGLIGEAEEVFDKLLGCDVASWNTLIAGYLENMQIEKVLKCLEQMLLEGVPPDAATFICNLKACGISKGIRSAHETHLFIAKLGMERDSPICSSLVTMYGECGLFAEAQQVFDKSLERQEALWNALSAGFNKHELSDEVLRCLEEMHLEGVLPTASMLVYGLKASGILKAMDTGREIHSQIAREGFERELFVGNSLIDMYGKMGALVEAKQVFEGLYTRDVVTWTAMIAAYTDHGCGGEALDCFENMQESKVYPNSVTYMFALKAASNVGAICKGQEIHSWVIKKGFEKGSFLCSSLMDMYVECDLLAEAFAVFSEQPVEDLASWNTLVRGYTDYGFAGDALSCLEQMRCRGIVMDPITLVCGLKASICLENIEKGRELYAEIVKLGFERVLFVGNTLLDLYAKFGSDAELRKIFDVLQDRDVVSWTALIAGYNEHGSSETVLACLKQMQLEGISPNVVTYMGSLQACEGLEYLEWGQHVHAEVVSDGCERDSFVSSCLVDMYCRYGLFAEALDVFDEQPIHDVVLWNTLISGYAEQEIWDNVLVCLQMMLLEGVILNVVTFICSLKACGSIGAVKEGRALHTQIILMGVEKLADVENASMDMYAKCGLLLEAQEMFDMLSVQDVVSWTMLLAAYVENGLGEKAMCCMEQMTQHGVALNAATFACSLRACGSIKAVEKGQECHAEIVRRGFEKDSFVCNALVDMYAKCGLLTEAEEVFDKLPVCGVISWSALVVSYAEQGFDEKVLECFERMQLGGILPDAFMLISFLKACGSMRALKKGQSMHADACKFGFLANPLVESAVVGMYAKCGSLVEAMEVFDKQRFRDAGSWNALIVAYTESGRNEEALECLKQMQVEGLVPNIISYLNILKACGNVGALNMGQELLSQIIKEGLGSNLMRWSGMKTVNHGKDQDVSSADVVELMLLNACVDMFGKCGSMIDAMHLFDAMASRDLVTWNALIWGYARQGHHAHVFCLFDRMEEEGIRPDKVTSLCVLNLCSHLGLLYQGQECLKALANDCGGVLSLEHLNCFLDLLGRAGQLDEAVEVLERLSFAPDLATWTTLLGACRSCGNEKLGRQALMSHEKDAGAFVLISNIYAEAVEIEKS